MPLDPSIRKVLVIGSGPIVIGQAAEFDYAGTQACKALKEQGLQVVLVNSNPATLMTDVTMADSIYIEPLIPETIKRIIEKEQPDSLLSTLGGQTGLTISMQLAKEGFLAAHGVRLLGAKPETIDKAEDRQLFKDTMESIGEPCIPSKVVTSVEDALDFAAAIGYPVIVRPAFTLGGTGGGGQSTGRTPETGTPGKQKSGRGGQGSRTTPKSGTERQRQDLEQTWREISERLQVDLETISRRHGTDAGNLVQELKAVNRETYDYADFLRRYASLGEVTQVNQDEFDYIYYTYGLSLYGNMPLVEPLEYKEVRRIKEFVIAIDTSGSVSGDLVQRFVTKTYNILRQQENFFTKINLHIIQCDAEIQEDRKITSQKDFDTYLDTMQLHGFGGTDFRPVFQYVDELIQAGEFTNLKGMIYFTDGRGIFPEKKPDYDAAFVFLDDGYDAPDVPVWAIKLVLQSEEI